jgi:glycosyltransferase involved in cell wall biosynthesis
MAQPETAGRSSRVSRPPGVSVILIVRNGERFLADALESVLLSSRRPAEVLVVDGDSTDRTLEIAARFPEVTLVRQRSAGLTNAYNEGIDLARGDLLAFISHDDRWLPGKLDRQVDYMVKHPEVLYTVTHVQHVLVPGAVPPPGFRTELLERPVPGFIMETLVARRRCFDTVGRLDPGIGVPSDTDWFARARDLGVPMAVLPETLVHKRVHGANASLTEPRINGMLLSALRNSIGRKRANPGAA